MSHEELRDSSLLPIVTALLGVALVVQALVFVLNAYQSLACPVQLDYGEGAILQLALRVAHGQELYPPFGTGYPYLVASYDPLYYVLCALGVRVTGPSFLFGRLVSLTSALAVAGCAGLIVWHKTRHRFASLLTAGQILAMPHFLVWSALMRVDMLALGLAMSGYYLYLRSRRAVAVPLFSLAALTRRTAVAAMLASVWREARESGPKAALRLLAAQLFLIAVLIATAMWWTRGGMYRQLSVHTASSLDMAWTWHQLGVLMHYLYWLWPVGFVVTAAGAAWCASRREHRDLLVFFALTCLVLLTGGRIGAGVNYLLEPLAVGAVMAGVLWGDLAPKASRARPLLMLLGGAIALQMVWLDLHMEGAISRIRPSAMGAAHVVERLRSAPGPVLCEDTGLIELAGKETPLQPFEFTQLARRRIIDPEPVYREVRSGRFSLIVLRFNPYDITTHRPGEDWEEERWPDGIISNLLQSYRLDEQAGAFFIFTPARTGSEREDG